ncbi:MAG: alpha-hydroxy acid oxidase [Novosphingobium sp.]|nr:alpha-hydroxy acid oxidase [Novosphingobium sp.]
MSNDETQPSGRKSLALHGYASADAGGRSGALSLNDYEELARRHLPRPLFGYLSGAAEENWSLDENRLALSRIGLVPRVLVDTGARTTATSLLGRQWDLPIGIAPMGLAALMAYRGDVALARAAAAENIPMILSGSSLTSLEEVAQAAPGSWFQAYLPAEHDWIDPMLDRVERAGYEVLVLTLDVPVHANRENLVRVGFTTPLRPSLRLAWDGLARPRWLAGTFARTLMRRGMLHFENSSAERGMPIIARDAARQFGQRDRVNWETLAHIRRRWKGRFLVKGVLHPDDARMAREHGVDGVIVSNHGGRQLDGAIAPIDALPGIVDAVGAGLPVMIDSGFRRGGDVLKALALGARMVFVGRPMLYAAAVGGEDEVRHAIGMMHTEIDRNMALMGVTRPDELTRGHVRAVRG